MITRTDTTLTSLRNGRRAFIRPVHERDSAAIQRFIRNLSPDSRYQRFLSTLVELPAEMLARVLAARGGRDTAVVVETYTRPGRIIGLAQLMNAGGTIAGEVAVVVADEWRREGLATLLLRRLGADALQAGYQCAYADVLRENAPALGLARRLGGELFASPHGAMLTRVVGRLQA